VKSGGGGIGERIHHYSVIASVCSLSVCHSTTLQEAQSNHLLSSMNTIFDDQVEYCSIKGEKSFSYA